MTVYHLVIPPPSLNLKMTRLRWGWSQKVMSRPQERGYQAIILEHRTSELEHGKQWKNKKLIFDFRTRVDAHLSLYIDRKRIERASNSNFLSTLAEDLTWNDNTAADVKKTQQWLCFQRTHRKDKLNAADRSWGRPTAVPFSVSTDVILLWFESSSPARQTDSEENHKKLLNTSYDNSYRQ